MAAMRLNAKQNTLHVRKRWMAARPAADAILALLLFALVSVTFGTAPTSANPHSPPPHVYNISPAQVALATGNDEPTIVEIATTTSPQAPDAIYGRTSATAAWLLLSLAFSLIFAFNLAILRHMRRVYAPKSGRPRQ